MAGRFDQTSPLVLEPSASLAIGDNTLFLRVVEDFFDFPSG